MTAEKILEMIVNSKNTIVIDEKVMKELGNNAAIVYSELKARYESSNKQGFVCTVSDLQYECNVSECQQKRIIKDLQDKGYIKVSYKGLPRKRFIEYVK